MEFVFSNHALEQMIRRNISKDQVLLTVKQYDFIMNQDLTTNIYSKLLEENSKSYLFRVFVNVQKKPSVIITVYKTSKTDKYAD